MNNTTVITGKNINLARMVVLRSALKLECLGMSRRGRSVYSIVKEEFNLNGNKKSVLQQLESLISKMEVDNVR